MSYLFRNILPAIQTIDLIGNTDQFLQWLKDTHPTVDNKRLFDGYVFSLQCCLNSFCDGLASDSKLDIKSDFLLSNAIAELIPIHKIDNSCEKTILLKRLKPFVKGILKSKTYAELKESIKRFHEVVSAKFYYILENCVDSTHNIEKSIAIRLSLVDFAQTFLVQIKNNGPVANSPNLLSVEWTNKERKALYFEGYKYAIQFLWYKLLGESFFETSLVRMNTASTWRNKQFIIKEANCGAKYSPFKNRDFNLEEQTDFDSYFYRISEEIVSTLTNDYGVAAYTIHNGFVFSTANYNKQVLFAEFLNQDGLEEPFEGLSWEDKIKNKLYWHPYEVIDAELAGSHVGIASFNTMLAGTVTLKKEHGNLERTVVTRFKHPLTTGNGKNDYSYGILVDTRSAAGHNEAGWIIYKNACCDYSGSVSEHKISEDLIRKYLLEDKIELRELIVPMGKFEEIISKETLTSHQLRVREHNKRLPDILQKAKAYLFELFVYYLYSYTSEYKTFCIKMNSDKKSKEGERDIVLEDSNTIILIECKLNPNNYDVAEMIDKIQKKGTVYKSKRVILQFWFWYPPSIQNQSLLSIDNIDVVVVYKNRSHPLLKTSDLSLLEYIMQDY